MSNGFGPLLHDLDAIRYDDRDYSLGCSWTSYQSWIEITGINHDDINHGRLALPDAVARKIAAAILLAEVYDGVVGPAEPLTDAFADDDPAAFARVLKRILADDLVPAGTSDA